MSDSADLERRYRRLLVCYPRSFRREHEQEMLSVLMAGAGDGQHAPAGRGPRSDQKRDLDASASRASHDSQPTMFWAVRLMYLCAALRLLGVPILPADFREVPRTRLRSA